MAVAALLSYQIPVHNIFNSYSDTLKPICCYRQRTRTVTFYAMPSSGFMLRIFLLCTKVIIVII